MQHRQASFEKDLSCAALARSYDDGTSSPLGVGLGLPNERPAQRLSQASFNLTKHPPDPMLLAEFGPRNALHIGVLPWRRIGHETVVLVENEESARSHLPSLVATFGAVRFGIADFRDIQSAIQTIFGRHLCKTAEQRLPADHSCRGWSGRQAGLWALIGACLIAIFGILSPSALMPAGTYVVAFGLLMLTALTLTAAFATLWNDPEESIDHDKLTPLPTISLLVPLFKEGRIAEHLLKRLSCLEYPRELLDVCLILEASDQVTQEAIAQIELPPWIRTLQVPKSRVTTKPKALNYALDCARGEIIGIYDAEDAPAPDQLHVVASGFANAPNDVGCLQGRLDYYNPTANWITRCFTIEYAAWFRVVLPGLARLGFAVPLGGTTIFFRRETLDKLGAWDAFNVTEDADLGIRLARRGFRTKFISSVTEEEANGGFWLWVRQRSRWLKGYAMTYALHMRRPLSLWRDLGAWRFFGFQLLFLGSLIQFSLAPLLWLFWLIPVLGGHPFEDYLPDHMVPICAGICFLSAASNLFIQCLGTYRARKKWLWPWTITMGLYFPLATVAVYKGLWEIIRKPFFWDKTAHGLLMPDDSTKARTRRLRRLVSSVSYRPG